MEVKGKIIKIYGEKIFSSGYKTQEFVVQTGEEKYPQYLLLQTQSDLTNYKIGDDVHCRINLRGRKWTNATGEDVYFNTIYVWGLNKLNNTNTEKNEENIAGFLGKDKTQIENCSNIDELESDLPF